MRRVTLDDGADLAQWRDAARGLLADAVPPADVLWQGGAQGDGADTLTLGPRMTSLPLREARELFEREYLLNQINRFGGNISRTAQFVGMERSALHRKLKSLGVVGGMRVEDEVMAK